jgi:hypothetical protein
VSRLENDKLEAIPLGKLDRCVDELGGYLRVDVAWRGEQLPRLIDARHAALQDRFVRILEAYGWQVRVEVSFNHYGDRGRIDILAYHPARRVLLVVEVKPDLGDVQDTLGRLDVKTRLALGIARELGWIATSAIPALVLEEGTSQRRQVEGHPGLFRRYVLVGRTARRWLRNKGDGGPMPSGILLFLKPPDSDPIGPGTR